MRAEVTSARRSARLLERLGQLASAPWFLGELLAARGLDGNLFDF